MATKVQLALHPPAELEKFDTGLRYTDILFGFVIRELFLRLQNWADLPGAVRWHLVVGLTLVLGSWIGFRNSLNRPVYQLKFFNLPLLRFLLDQLMLILYFRVAVLTPVPDAHSVWDSGPEWASNLARHTQRLVLYVFFLYALWDLLGIWMAKTKDKDGKPRYPKVKANVETKTWTMVGSAQPDRWGLGITTVCFLLSGALWTFANCLSSSQLFGFTAASLLLYRFCKEIRTSCKPSPQP
jgi:hypothetical protein